MSDKYPSISPYAYCAWNPVKLVDPDGRDIWEINQQGKIVNRIKTTERDAFYIVDDKGNRMIDENNMLNNKSISFKYGSIKELSTNYRLLNQTRFNITDNSTGADLFKFLADNTSVEYGLVATKESGSYVLSNHDNSKVGASAFARSLDRKGTTILSIAHNHPLGSPPSGYDKNDNRGDRFRAQEFVSSHGHNVNYFVYTKQNQTYTMYDGKTKYDNINPKINHLSFKKNFIK